MKTAIVWACVLTAGASAAIDFNAPVEKLAGAIYFTDPPYGVKRAERELDFQGVYRISPDGKALTLVARDFIAPNGLAFSPDEKILYIADSKAGRIRAFDVVQDGTLANGRVFTDRTPTADGMKVDTEGNVCCTSENGVMVFAPTGAHLGTFVTPEQPANCAFGDADWKSLYMTCRTGLYRIRLAVPGRSDQQADRRGGRDDKHMKADRL